RVRAIRVLRQRRPLARPDRRALGTRYVREAAGRGRLVVVALERAVAGERVVVGVRGLDVDLQGGAEGLPTVARLLVEGVDRRREEGRLSRLVALAVRDVDPPIGAHRD